MTAFAIVLIAGIATGLLMALFGIGGGAFIVPVLDSLFARLPGVPAPPFKLAVISSLVAIGLGSIYRALQVYRNREASMRNLWVLVAGSLPATFAGIALLNYLSSEVLRSAFAVALAMLGAWTALGTPRSVPERADGKTHASTGLMLAIGAVSGMASSLFGLGGATLLVPLMTMLAGISTAGSAVVSVIFVAIASVQSLAVFGLSVAVGEASLAGIAQIHILLIAVLTVALVIAQQFFLRHTHRMPDLLRRRLLGTYLMIAAAWMLREAFVR